MTYQPWNQAQVERFFQAKPMTKAQSDMELICNADNPWRKALLERITLAEMEWYYANGYIR